MISTTRWIAAALCAVLASLPGCSDGAVDPPAGSPLARDAGRDRDARAERDSGSPSPEDAAAPEPDPSGLPDLCSGCEGEPVDVGDNAAHFHHVHLNTADLAESRAFYQRVFGTTSVHLNDVAVVEKAEGALLLMETVPETPSAELDRGIEHFGWGAIDVNAWYAEASGKDIRLDERSGPLSGPVELFPNFFYLYLQGPSNERIEVNTDDHDEFGHVHFMTDDVDATVGWYTALLGVTAAAPQASETMFELAGMPVAWSSNSIQIDEVNMIFFGPPFAGLPELYEETDGGPIDHIAFCFADLDPIIERVAELELDVVAEAEVDARYGFRSLLLRAPNRVLIELVEAPAIPNPFP